MRQSTINKLFGAKCHDDPEFSPYSIMRGTSRWKHGNDSDFTKLLINGRVVIIQEYPSEAAGFEVFIAPTVNRIQTIRDKLGIDARN